MIIKNIQNLWHNAVNSIQSAGAVFAGALVKSIEDSGGQILRDAATAAVAAAEAAGGSGDAKFDAAKKIIVKILKSNGIPLVENAIQGAIIAAVASMNTGK